jgi:hypothetical protein
VGALAKIKIKCAPGKQARVSRSLQWIFGTIA